MGSRDSKSVSVTIRCNAVDAVHAMVEGAQDFCIGRGLEPAQGARLVIIVEELVTNLVEHGEVAGDSLIELVLTEGDGAIGIALSDAGVAYDPRAAEPSGTIPERGGGAGLDLIKAWAEFVDYQSRNGRNRLLLKMWLS
jgi:anti-sigma regulatory factor (Ser/Thr protein kinase)